MTYMKGIELFAESIPAVIIQIMAIVTDEKGAETSAWVSLAVSALSTGFIGATISYDWDTDPEKRRKTPGFYGYVPNKARKRTLGEGKGDERVERIEPHPIPPCLTIVSRSAHALSSFYFNGLLLRRDAVD